MQRTNKESHRKPKNAGIDHMIRVPYVRIEQEPKQHPYIYRSGLLPPIQTPHLRSQCFVVFFQVRKPTMGTHMRQIATATSNFCKHSFLSFFALKDSTQAKAVWII